MVQKQDIGVSAAVFIVDDQQRLIAHSNTKDFSPKLQDFSDHPALQAALPDASFSQGSSLQHILIDDIPHVFLVRDVGLGWQLVVQQSYSEAYSPYLELRSVALYLIIASVLLVLLLAWALSAHIVTPLSRMNTIADGYTKGRFDESIPYVDRKDEIGELAHAITRMSMSLRLAFQHVNPSKTPSKNDP